MPLRLPAALFVAALALPIQAAEPKPTGRAGRGLEQFDKIMLDTLEKHNIPGAAVAIAKDGRLVFARGYGWADVVAQEQVQPTTLFNLASCTKPFTGAAILKLVDDGKLKLDDRVYTLLKDVKPPQGVKLDPRYQQITVRQMLHHAAGLPRAGNAGKGATLEEYVSENMRLPLQYDPGTKTAYSNLGFIILRLVVKQTAKEDYEKYSQTQILAPAGIKDMRLDSLATGYFKGEAHRYIAGKDKPLPGGQGAKFEENGCWTASAIDVVRFMTALDGSRGKPIISRDAYKQMLAPLPPPFRAGERHNGLGWDTVEHIKGGKYFYEKNGGIAGITTYMEHQPSGVNFAILFNASPNAKEKDNGESGGAWRKEIIAAIRQTEKWPPADFFEKFP